MAVDIEAILDIAAALSQEGYPNSAKHLRDAVSEIERLSAIAVGIDVGAGMVLVPCEPTETMVEAGWRSQGDSVDGRPCWKQSVDVQARHIYKAMIAAVGVKVGVNASTPETTATTSTP